MQLIDGIPVWGTPLGNAVEQMKNCLKTANKVALMADHHLGYAVPIGGVLAYKDKVSPSGVGFDIACGNKAVLTNIKAGQIEKEMPRIMDEIIKYISFGMGRQNNEPVDHSLFDSPAWHCDAIAPHKEMARKQLGTVGGGNHYVDIFKDETDRVWVGVHFGSRGLGHKAATYFIKAAGGKDGINVDPVVIDASSSLGAEYIECMALAGQYAYAGRDYVCQRVVEILGGEIEEEVHNHHNFAWRETHQGEDYWVVRKGATPAFPGQKGFVGGSMGENSVILEGVDSTDGLLNMYSTVHGAGRVMSRTEAAGKVRYIKGVRTRITEGKVSKDMMRDWVVGRAKVELRGGGTDESPHAYKRLDEVLSAHSGSVKILHTLTPMGVAMASDTDDDPYKD